jgi:hypothetical protein
MLSRGPELRMEISQEKEGAALKISTFKGKKYVFRDNILVKVRMPED